MNSNFHRNYNINIYHGNKKILRNEYKIENTEDYGLCEPCEFYDLLEQLKNIRREMLKKENDNRKNNSKDGNFIPLKLDDIISDISLKEIVRNLPTKLEDLSKEDILDKYADKILSIIIKFINIYDIDINKRKENREINLYYGDKNDLKYIYESYENNKIYNEKNCSFMGFKRNYNNSIKKECDCKDIFNELDKKNKKKKKAKFL